MKKTISLRFEKPVNAEINMNGGQFGAPRHHGPHQGQDFKAPLGSTVMASESGIVVYSGTREGSTTRTNYGDTIVIDHTPEAGRMKGTYTLFMPTSIEEMCMKGMGPEREKRLEYGQFRNGGLL